MRKRHLPENNLIIVLLRYPKEMQRLLDSNPGLCSRFPTKLHFADYSLDEMVEIGENMVVEVSDLDHPRGVKKSKKIPPKSGSPVWFLVLFGHPILAGGYEQDTTLLNLIRK